MRLLHHGRGQGLGSPKLHALEAFAVREASRARTPKAGPVAPRLATINKKAQRELLPPSAGALAAALEQVVEHAVELVLIADGARAGGDRGMMLLRLQRGQPLAYVPIAWITAGDLLEIVEGVLGLALHLVHGAEVVIDVHLLLDRLVASAQRANVGLHGAIELPLLQVHHADHGEAVALPLRIASSQLELVQRIGDQPHLLVRDAEVVVRRAVILRHLGTNPGAELLEHLVDIDIVASAQRNAARG